MASFTLALDLPIMLGAYLLSVCAAMFWLYRPTDSSVAVSPRSAARVAIRLAILFVVISLVCFLLNISTWLPLAVVTVLLGLGLLPGAGISGLFPLAILYMMQQYVLGFPDHDELILPKPESRGDDSMESVLRATIGKVAETMSPLKPSGEVEIDSERFSALSEDSQFVGADTKVLVVGVKNSRLIVRL